ncbi:MAG: hypothetical protein U5L96_04655 [Owenweeksia sp.]|nr:hypothetical protein [Owenweeksia sp.]
MGEALKAILEQEGSSKERLDAFASRVNSSEIGKKGIEEVTFLLNNLSHLKTRRMNWC